jgi:Flp pilus assembly protein TadD
MLANFAALVLLAAVTAKGQDNLDPSEIWYRGYLLVQAAEGLEDQKNYLAALNKLSEAEPLFTHLAQAFPEYQPEIVRERRRLIAEKRDEIRRLMRPSAINAPNPPHLVGAGVPSFDSMASSSPSPGVSSVVPPPLTSHGTVPRTMEVEEPDGEFTLPSWDNGSSQVLPRISGGAEGVPRVETRRPTVGAIANSLHTELANKDSLISWLNEENQKLRREIAQRESLLERARNDLDHAQANVEQLQRREAAARASGGTESREKVEELKDLLKSATEQLQDSVDTNAQLVTALSDSQQEIKKLRSRMAELERERDNLAEVVRGEGNGGTALKELMDRNRELTAQLDRAEQLATSLSELNKEKDQDIVLLKSEINNIKFERDRLLSENLRHQQSIEELQRKLELLSDGLSEEERSAIVMASPVERQENELLRSIVLKQLRRQAQMKQAKELLVRQLDKVGNRSDTLLGLIEDIATGAQLTEEEKALFRAPQFQELVEAASTDTPRAPAKEVQSPDEGAADANAPETATMSATLVAPGSGPPPDAVIQNKKVSVELAQIDKAARLDFKEGRYAESEAGFLEYLRLRPRSVSCLCNLGVLKIAMKNFSEAEYFLERALALDEKSGLAHYLLGRAYFLQGKLDDALSKLETGLTFEPQNAKAHNCIGVISSQKGWLGRAENAFTSAVSIDPKFGDAHYNLAVLYATRDEPDSKAAEKHYFEALHLGVPRNASIEEFLKEAEAAGTSIGMR